MRLLGESLVQHHSQHDIPPYARHASHLATVVAVDDPDGLSRVQIRLLNYDGVDEQDGPIWARVATPFAGADRGAFFLPDVDDEVLVSFVNGDPRLPIVIGGLWNGSDQPPETLGGSGDRIDRWTIVGKAGTRIAIVEENSGEETIKLETPGGVSLELTDASGGKLEINAAGTQLVIDSSGLSVTTGGTASVEGSQIELTAGMVKADSGIADFSGMVKCNVLSSPTVLGQTYTPGAGNVW